MDGAQARVQTSMNTMIESLDKNCLRKMQADMYRCSVQCCENNNLSLEQVQNCIEQCSSKVNNAQNHIQGEIQMFQNRLQRCVMSCDDKVRNKISTSSSEADMAKFRAEVEACAVKCADEYVDLIPGLTKKLLETTSKNNF